LIRFNRVSHNILQCVTLCDTIRQVIRKEHMSNTKEGTAFTIYIRHDVKEALIKRARELDRSPSWIINNTMRSPLGLNPREIK